MDFILVHLVEYLTQTRITSRGSSDRKATALDTSKKITLANATAIKNAGYTDIGRYLTNTPNSTFDKAMTYEELEILKSVGLNIFPIFRHEVMKHHTLQQYRDILIL